MKSIIISDSFKGTLSSYEISEIFSDSFNSYYKNSTLIKRLVADGGEGTIDCLYSNIGGTFIYTKTNNPYFNLIDTKYLVSGDTAYIELSESAGITKIDNLNPKITSTYGVGEQIKDAIEKGYKRIVIACGGSSTNDAGCGALSAMGFKFLNKLNESFIPTGDSLNQIESIINPNIYNDIEFTIMSDCINPMHGKCGAAYIYAPQKGATKEDVILLDNNLKYLDNLYKTKFNKDISNIKGCGAAGAFPSSFMALLNTKIISGINILLDSMDFDNLINNTDYVFTGEGKFDSQSLSGKVISGILDRCKKKNTKVIIICGKIDDDIKNIDLNSYGIYKIFETSHGESKEYIKSHSKEMYKETLEKVFKELDD